MTRVKRFIGQEVLDSRGNPTVAAICELVSGASGYAAVPAGASRGKAEATELRDGELNRYAGLGCRRAAANISGPISASFVGARDVAQLELDEALIRLDGTEDKGRLGANAILAASMSFAIASASEQGVPLFSYFSQLLGQAPKHLPRPTINLFSGGKHAGGQVSIQDVLLVTISATTADDALAMTSAVYRAATDIVRQKYYERPLVADEGGLAPLFSGVTAMLDDAVAAIETAGLKPGSDMAICVDLAASEFYDSGLYRLGAESLTAAEMISLVVKWLDDYPILSVEDALASEDWDNWAELVRRVDGRALVLGDDLLVTNPGRIQRAVEMTAASALLLKVNQIGTLTEALEACQLAKKAGWDVSVSARSGETEDNWLTDLAVGWSGNQLKVGSLTRSERLSKWNRLLSIERDTGLPLAPPPASNN